MQMINRILCGLIALALMACGEPSSGPTMGELHSGDNLIQLVYDSPPGPVRKPIFLTMKVPRSYIYSYRKSTQSPDLQLQMLLPAADSDPSTVKAADLKVLRDDDGGLLMQSGEHYPMQHLQITVSRDAEMTIKPYGFIRTYGDLVKAVHESYLITGERQFDLEKYLWGGCGEEPMNSRPLQEVLAKVGSECYIAPNTYWLAPEIEGRSIFIKCVEFANCMAGTSWNGFTVKYFFDRKRLADWRDMDRIVFGFVSSLYVDSGNFEGKQ